MREKIYEVIARQIALSTRPATSNRLAEWMAGGRIVAFHRNFVEVTENATAALLLSQMWYWSQTPTAEEREGWFWMTQNEIYEQTGITRHEQETARKRLRDMGLLEEERRGLPAKMWFRLDKERFFSLAQILLDSKEEIEGE